MLVRAAGKQDQSAIATLIRAAFPEEEREDIVELAQALNHPAEADNLALVADEDGAITGYIAFSPLQLSGDKRWRGYLLSPLAVSPDLQRRGVGTLLIEKGVASLKERDVDWLLVYGDPAYYGRFGFEASLAEHLEAPFPLTYPFGWQALQIAGDASSAKGTLTCVAALHHAHLW